MQHKQLEVGLKRGVVKGGVVKKGEGGGAGKPVHR